MVKPCLKFLGPLHKHYLRKTTTEHCLGQVGCLIQQAVMNFADLGPVRARVVPDASGQARRRALINRFT